MSKLRPEPRTGDLGHRLVQHRQASLGLELAEMTLALYVEKYINEASAEEQAIYQKARELLAVAKGEKP